MLEELTIRNYALIEEVSLQFKEGFNVLTGETGAGKSILIDALSLTLGSKGRAESIREGAEEAEVTAVFRVENTPELSDWVAKYGIEPEDGLLLIRRTLKRSGRGLASVQGVSLTRAALGELAEALVDIHGQHEHQSLFKISVHRKLLDRFSGIENRVKAFTEMFSRLSDLGRQMENLEKENAQMAREAEFLRFAVEEIDSAELKEGEEENLEERQKILSMHEELAANMEKILEYTSESRSGALNALRNARDLLGKTQAVDSSFGEIVQRFDSAFYELEDIVEEVRKRRDLAEYNPEELAAIDERLARINMLERKYGEVSVSAVKAYAERARSRLEGFDNQDEKLGRLKAERDALHSKVRAEASALSRIRRKFSESLQIATEKHLRALGMADAEFKVELEGKTSSEGRSVIGPYGSDVVEFLLSANRGEPLHSLKSVASGGELSRVMLALKTALSESDTIGTMIFDEVDTGIGGEVARSVGEHLHGLSLSKQVFCVTHLASIAVFADNHLKVYKESSGGRTLTGVKNVDGNLRVREVARMLAGDGDDSASLDHAARLLEEKRADAPKVAVK